MLKSKWRMPKTFTKCFNIHSSQQAAEEGHPLEVEAVINLWLWIAIDCSGG
jgi:hypothetical protein